MATRRRSERVAPSRQSGLFRSRNAAAGVHALVVLAQHHDDVFTGLHPFGKGDAFHHRHVHGHRGPADFSNGSVADVDGAVAEPGRTGILDAVIVRETADTGSPQKAPMRLVIAKANPAVSEHTAYTVDAIDNVLGIIDIASGDYEDLDGSHAIARIDTTINLPLDGTTVWVGAIAQGAVTYAASANIDIELQIISD